MATAYASSRSAPPEDILTALYFHGMREGDRIAVKPHASPVYRCMHIDEESILEAAFAAVDRTA